MAHRSSVSVSGRRDVVLSDILEEQSDEFSAARSREFTTGTGDSPAAQPSMEDSYYFEGTNFSPTSSRKRSIQGRISTTSLQSAISRSSLSSHREVDEGNADDDDMLFRSSVTSGPRTSTASRVSLDRGLDLLSGGAVSPGRGQRPSGRFSSNLIRSLSFKGPSSGTGDRLSFDSNITSNLSRKSQSLRNSIARHSTALARFGRPSNPDIPDLEDANRIQRGATHRYAIGDAVLVSNSLLRLGNSVNRHGFPPGAGFTSEEQRGPYIYVLGTVKTVHYEENAVFYTITRADTGIDVRGDPDTMLPIMNQAGEDAARRAAARDSAMGGGVEELEEEDIHLDSDGKDGTLRKCCSHILEVLLLPFFLIYDLLFFVIGNSIFRWFKALVLAIRKQAHGFLTGQSPYHCSTTVTSVNVIVVCTIWYMLVDSARLAFVQPDYDRALAVINFIVWCILSVELFFEVFIRPDNFLSLIHSEKAYTPTTVRFISGLHLVVEFISLAFFVPEFLCLFTEDSCSDRYKFSFLNATMMAVAGPTIKDYAFGRLYYACVRLRVFSLVRHWRNRWLKVKFLNSGNLKIVPANFTKIVSGNRSRSSDMDDENSVIRVVANRIEQKHRDNALINASNIGTALMLTNSYRALAILCAITGFFPLITLIGFSGGATLSSTSMAHQLAQTNALVNVESYESCQFFASSVTSWTKMFSYLEAEQKTSDTDHFLVAFLFRPARCYEYFRSIDSGIGDYEFGVMDCGTYDETTTGLCMFGRLPWAEIDWSNDDARVGNILDIAPKPVDGTLTSLNGTVTEETFSVVARFNFSRKIETSALSSFILQFTLLLTVLASLSILRKDAEDLVLRPLRSMLKIVARYAKNPLSQATPVGRDNYSVISDVESEVLSIVSDADASEADHVETYETEQLITAVAKITDLLRKCWGVAGADIISTNLASSSLAEVFNPTVPGKSVYALFAFAAIDGFDHALKCLGGDVMILINDVASVLHNEVYRWGFGDSGQCNKNLGAAFLMVFRIGLVKEVDEKLKEAAQLVFSTSETKKVPRKKTPKQSSTHTRGSSDSLKPSSRARNGSSSKQENDLEAKKLSLQSLPGIAMFTDRAVIGMLKSFAGIDRDEKLRGWSRDFRLSAGVGAFDVKMIFGMDAGWAVEGAVGSEYKIDATYLSPHVNMASRMMSACKHYGVTILLSEAVQELMSDTAKSKLRNVDRVTVKGSATVQKIYTFDVRQNADFFLFGRSDEDADMAADAYVPSIWNTDQDLASMRQHVSVDFETEFKAGMKAYYTGNWPTAIKRFEKANEIMIEAAMEEGYLHDEMEDTEDRFELYRRETADGPCNYLINFMKSQGSEAPAGWDGWHPLLSK
eukprot:Nitzschia sp. Nitz4//scaffold89_size161592//92699//96967//NITZ4_002385-RA/size161592-snap-gene-0.176-mRNA-1//-1//CDS//3329559637//94//frame0